MPGCRDPVWREAYEAGSRPWSWSRRRPGLGGLARLSELSTASSCWRVVGLSGSTANEAGSRPWSWSRRWPVG